MKELAEMIATLAKVGYMRPAPGTWGSAISVALFWAAYNGFGFLLLCALLIASFVLGLWATQEYTRDQDNHDPSEVVIDELVGQWIALLPVAYGAMFANVPMLNLWPGMLTAFILFRLFDIWKPLWVGTFDKRNDPLGVMLDDVVAGVFAAIGVIIFGIVAHMYVL